MAAPTLPDDQFVHGQPWRGVPGNLDMESGGRGSPLHGPDLLDYLKNHPCDDDLITGSYVRDSDD